MELSFDSTELDMLKLDIRCCFSESVSTIIPEDIVAKCREFAQEVNPTTSHNYRARGVSIGTVNDDLIKKAGDHFIGKVAEYGVRQILADAKIDMPAPDTAVYGKTDKSYKSDLFYLDYGIDCKAARAWATARCDYSWVIQYDGVNIYDSDYKFFGVATPQDRSNYAACCVVEDNRNTAKVILIAIPSVADLKEGLDSATGYGIHYQRMEKPEYQNTKRAIYYHTLSTLPTEKRWGFVEVAPSLKASINVTK